MDIKTKFNIGEKVFYNINSILTIVKAHPLFNDEDIFGHCYGEGFVVGIEISFDAHDKKPIIMYIISGNVNIDAEDIVSNNREELEKTIHDVHIAELKTMNEKIMNLMK